MTLRILRLPAVMNQTGLSRSTIYLKIKNNTFPKPVPLGTRAVGWSDTEVSEWIDSRIKLSWPNGGDRE